MRMMKANKIDVLNIYLIFISLIIAIKMPFELFLFSYAVLGPLHYLTEINWLHKKNYFIKVNKNWTILFIIIAIIVTIYPLLKFIGIDRNEALGNFILLLKGKTKVLLLIGFLFAISLTFLKQLNSIAFSLICIVFISFVTMAYFPRPFILIGLFLPTLIHVYVFTLLFVFYGALKSKSSSGFYLGIILFLIPFLISYIPISYLSYEPSKEIMDAFVSSNMVNISKSVSKILNVFQGDKVFLLSEIGLRIQMFIAFAYTYHYLNWFSKTSIIGWKEVITKRSAFFILLIWIGSIALYIYDFRTGFIALFFLSFLHVLLEFPLNIITIKELLLFSKKNLIKTVGNSKQ